MNKNALQMYKEAVHLHQERSDSKAEVCARQ